MRNIKLVIEYDGTEYHGWQLQPEMRTIQGEIESRLSMITKTKVPIVGAGRTDAGVHALGQTANFLTESKMTPDEFKVALNSVLPEDIVIKNAQEVDEDFNSRYTAIGRTYRYTILNDTTPSAFLRNYAYMFPRPIDIDSMAEACKSLLGTHDFSSFASTGDAVKSYIRIVENARIEIKETSESDNIFCEHPSEQSDSIFCEQHRLIHFQIQANAFLRCMVRAIIGTLLEIGKGKIPADRMWEVINAKDRSAAGPCLPARGLCLMKVDYP